MQGTKLNKFYILNWFKINGLVELNIFGLGELSIFGLLEMNVLSLVALNIFGFGWNEYNWFGDRI